jgi:polyisoprenoid-binding protein YceI
MFVAVGPGGIKMEGKTSELEVKDLRKTLTVVVPLTHLSTGIDLRDSHMKEKYLETGKYPTAELKVPRADLKLHKGGEGVQSEIKATLRLHGQEKPVTVKYQAKPVPGGYEIVGSFRLNMTEYGIAVPEYLGVTVKPDVEITASFKVK